MGDGGSSSGSDKTDGLGGTTAPSRSRRSPPATERRHGKLAMDDFVEKGEAEGWDVTLYTSSFDYDKLNSDVQAAIAQGADAVMAGFPDPRQIAPIVQSAQDADIPIFSIDGGVEANPDFVIDETFGQQAMADQTIAALGEAMDGIDGKNVMVIGHDPHVGIHTRSNMAVETLEQEGATIVGGEMKQVLDPGTSRTEALNFVTDYLQANPEGLDGVWAGWDDAALGAVQAIEEAAPRRRLRHGRGRTRPDGREDPQGQPDVRHSVSGLDRRRRRSRRPPVRLRRFRGASRGDLRRTGADHHRPLERRRLRTHTRHHRIDPDGAGRPAPSGNEPLPQQHDTREFHVAHTILDPPRGHRRRRTGRIGSRHRLQRRHGNGRLRRFRLRRRCRRIRRNGR